jgi:NTP pyrophosphatase (non-canonical NTP hydrolase)
MERFLKVISTYKSVLDYIKQQPSLSDATYNMESLETFVKVMFEKHCPFKVGDRAKLSKTPDINEKDSWGWMGSKHFLVKGKEGTIESVDFSRDEFMFGFIPDNQTYIPSFTDKTEKPINDPHIFMFSESWLEPIESKIKINVVKGVVRIPNGEEQICPYNENCKCVCPDPCPAPNLNCIARPIKNEPEKKINSVTINAFNNTKDALKRLETIVTELEQKLKPFKPENKDLLYGSSGVAGKYRNDEIANHFNEIHNEVCGVYDRLRNLTLYPIKKDGLNGIADAVHELAWKKGWHSDSETEDAFIERACNNLHNEVSELHEAWRNNELHKPCDKTNDMELAGISPLTFIEEEFADIIIRTLDNCRKLKVDIQSAVERKHAYNATRAQRHGGKRS